MTFEIIPNVISQQESAVIVADLLDFDPEIATKSLHLELDDSFQYLDYLPNIHVPNLDHLIGRYAVTMNGAGWYPGDTWHTDGTSDEVSVLLYLSGDNSQGGDFLTRTSHNQFQLNSLFVFDSSVEHYVTPYTSSQPRIAFKWRYKKKVSQLLGPLFY